jgi:hypothetical protein
VNLIFEQIALYIISTTADEDAFDSKISSSNSVTQRLLNDSRDFLLDAHSDLPGSLDDKLGATATAVPSSSVCSRSHSRQMSVSDPRSRLDSCEVGAVVAVFANANDPRALLKAYVLEGAIAVHSVIMGVSLGSMQGDELANIKILMIAYAVHQLLEGVSLG